MITFWLVVLLLQGGDIVAFGYPSQDECKDERTKLVGQADVLAASECFQTSLARTSGAPKVGL